MAPSPEGQPGRTRRRALPDLLRREGWLLDLDGTLVDSSDGVILAFHSAQRAFGETPARPDAIRSRIGYPLTDTVAALSRVDYASFIEVFRAEALATMHLHSRLLPGALELLEWLAAHRRLCAMVTSKRGDIAFRILEHLGVNRHFETVVGSDAAAEVKPHPAPLLEAAHRLGLGPDRLVMVGDTQNDIRAAHSAGMPVVALASGYDGRSLLSEADLIFDDASALVRQLLESGDAAELRPPRLRLFSRHECPLCDELKDRLKQRSIPFEEHDIRSRADWFDRYRERIPVVLLPGGEECDPPFSDILLASWAAVYR